MVNMNKILYREVLKEDYEDIKILISNAFGIHKFITDKIILDRVLNIYLHSCLSAKTFSKVAILNEKVIGIILGSVKDKRKLSNTIKHSTSILLNNLSILLHYKKADSTIKEYKKIQIAYDELISNKAFRFQGCVELFIVSEEIRGLGLGKKLLSSFFKYLKENLVSNIYLYTDSICNFGFYDSQGFKREEAINIEIANEPLDVYLYSYCLN